MALEMPGQGALDAPEFLDALNAAHKLYDRDQLPECQAACESLLAEGCGRLSRYLRIRTLILAAASTKNYFEAEDWRKEAEALWGFGRAICPPAPPSMAEEGRAPSDATAPQDTISDVLPKPRYATPGQEANLQELRVMLDELKEVQTEEKKWLEEETYELPAGAWVRGDQYTPEVRGREFTQEEKDEQLRQAIRFSEAIDEEAAIKEEEARLIDLAKKYAESNEDPIKKIKDLGYKFRSVGVGAMLGGAQSVADAPVEDVVLGSETERSGSDERRTGEEARDPPTTETAGGKDGLAESGSHGDMPTSHTEEEANRGEEREVAASGGRLDEASKRTSEQEATGPSARPEIPTGEEQRSEAPLPDRSIEPKPPGSPSKFKVKRKQLPAKAQSLTPSDGQLGGGAGLPRSDRVLDLRTLDPSLGGEDTRESLGDVPVAEASSSSEVAGGGEGQGPEGGRAGEGGRLGGGGGLAGGTTPDLRPTTNVAPDDPLEGGEEGRRPRRSSSPRKRPPKPFWPRGGRDNI